MTGDDVTDDETEAQNHKERGPLGCGREEGGAAPPPLQKTQSLDVGYEADTETLTRRGKKSSEVSATPPIRGYSAEVVEPSVESGEPLLKGGELTSPQEDHNTRRRGSVKNLAARFQEAENVSSSMVSQTSSSQRHGLFKTYY